LFVLLLLFLFFVGGVAFGVVCSILCLLHCFFACLLDSVFVCLFVSLFQYLLVSSYIVAFDCLTVCLWRFGVVIWG
jgi:hypothetical protein